MSIEDTFKASPLFAGFSPTGVQILASIATEKAVQRGTPLFAENMVADALLFVVEGRVAICMKNAEGKDQYIASLGPGDHLGELALMSPSTRMCSALAESDLKLVEIRADAFRKMLAAKPQACLKLMMNISAELGKKMNANKDSIRSLALAAKTSAL